MTTEREEHAWYTPAQWRDLGPLIERLDRQQRELAAQQAQLSAVQGRLAHLESAGDVPSGIVDSHRAIGDRVRQARRAREWTQAQLGQQLARPRSHAAISDIERGVTKLDIEEIAELARLLNTSVESLIARPIGPDRLDRIGVRLDRIESQLADHARPIALAACWETGEPPDLGGDLEITTTIVEEEGTWFYEDGFTRPGPPEITVAAGAWESMGGEVE